MRFTSGTLEIEISAINPIEGGVEVFARAWDEGKPLGFGDGSIETERFRIFKPPTLVRDDINGTIVKEWENPAGKVVQKFREDPEEAIRHVIAHNISLVGKKDTAIVSGSIGNTTDTFFPAAGANSPVDGIVFNSGATYATVQSAGSGSSADVVGDTLETDNLLTGGSFRIRRAFILFNTAVISGDVISAATLSIFGTSAGNADSDFVRIVTTTPASDSTLATSDFGNVGTAAQANDFDINSWSGVAYNDFTFNATGISNINKAGVSHFGMRLLGDVNATQPAGVTFIDGNSADHAGTTNDPKLVVVHAIAKTGGAFLYKMV